LIHAIGIQSFAFQKSQTADHFDLMMGSHDSAMVTDLQSFRFNGIKNQSRFAAPQPPHSSAMVALAVFRPGLLYSTIEICFSGVVVGFASL
jgi:hypothetical protein